MKIWFGAWMVTSRLRPLPPPRSGLRLPSLQRLHNFRLHVRPGPGNVKQLPVVGESAAGQSNVTAGKTGADLEVIR